MTKRDYEMEWMGLGYRKGMGSAKFLPPPDRNFVRAYHLTSAEHGISSISLRRLKVARFSEVNDPFELMALNFHKREIRQLVRRFKDSHNSKTGLLCFSANWTNPVLWSHYATRHEGICLGFDLRREKVQEVLYKDKRLPPELNDKDPLAIPKTLQNLLLLTKSRHYQYEEEFRVFLELSGANREQGLYFRPFDKDLRLAEVILGPRNGLSLPAIRELTDTTNRGAVVFRARLAFRSFDVVGDGRYPPEISSDAA